jgi:hypothetical protein
VIKGVSELVLRYEAGKIGLQAARLPGCLLKTRRSGTFSSLRKRNGFCEAKYQMTTSITALVGGCITKDTSDTNPIQYRMGRIKFLVAYRMDPRSHK